MPPAPPPAPPPSVIDTPEMTVVVVDLYHVFTFYGTNQRDGDQAYLVKADEEGSADCRTAMPRTSTRVVLNYTVTLTVSVPGLHVLCYMWSAHGVTLVQPHIRVAAMWVHTIYPLGTGLGCATNMTLEGAGFLALKDDTPRAACHFKYPSDDVLKDATMADYEYIRPAVLTANAITCPTPILTKSSPGLAIGIGSELVFTVEIYLGDGRGGRGDNISDRTFVLDQAPFNMPWVNVFDPDIIEIHKWSPGGARYNRYTNISIQGANFIDAGNASCTFGPSLTPPYRMYQGEWAVLEKTTEMVCDFPTIPDEERDQLGELNFEYRANGQCPSSTANVSFWTWNALLDSVTPIAAPFTTAVTLNIAGEGFPLGFHPDLSKAECRFSSPTSGRTVSTPLATLSETKLLCPTPSTDTVGRRLSSAFLENEKWSLDVLFNGQQSEPFLFGTPLFTFYDLSRVKVFSTQPVGGPVGGDVPSIAVTVHGDGFEDFGDMLSCVVGASRTAESMPGSQIWERYGAYLDGSYDTMGEVVPARLLDDKRVLCNMPRCADHRCTAKRLGATTVTVSLNNGTNGTLAYYEEPFRYYLTPTIYDLYPNSGNATGGNLVTIVGVGFLGFSPNASDPDVTAEALSHLRVRFGANVQRYMPLVSYSDSEIVCVTPWGTEDTGGVPFSLALNGVTFGVTGVPVRFYYKGLHLPVLVDVYFPQAATTLIIQFDNQPTDRAAANGRHPCTDILTASTARTLRGNSSAAPLCEWRSASQLIAYLQRDTGARPGMHVEVLPGLVCAAGHPELCATENLTWTIDADFPCDRAETDALEECVQPMVVIRGPEVVGGCPDTPIALDASDYSGGGIRPLSFEWMAHPSKCDNYYSLSAQLETQKDQEQLALLTSKGSSYLFMLTATNFLGRKSEVLQ